MRLLMLNYREIERECGGDGAGLPSLSDAVSSQPQDHEEDIARYLERAPNYCAMGKVVGDALNPSEGAILVPGTNTDGLYLWPLELAFYVRKYHVRLPQEFVERMAALNWEPPSEASVDWKGLHAAMAEQAGVPLGETTYQETS